LRYISNLTCAHPLRVHDGAETPSTISLKQASTIAEIRTVSPLLDFYHQLWSTFFGGKLSCSRSALPALFARTSDRPCRD
jgi:hypothetical protein